MYKNGKLVFMSYCLLGYFVCLGCCLFVYFLITVKTFATTLLPIHPSALEAERNSNCFSPLTWRFFCLRFTMEILKPNLSSPAEPSVCAAPNTTGALINKSHHHRSTYHNNSISPCDLAITGMAWILIIFTEFLSSNSIEKLLKQLFD